jgi:hypothetical protein
MVQNSVSKFVRERHPVPTNANFSVITNAPFARDRYDARRELRFRVEVCKFGVVYNNKGEFFPSA